MYKIRIAKNMTVNQMVAGSSPAEGAKPRTIAGFLFLCSISTFFTVNLLTNIM